MIITSLFPIVIFIIIIFIYLILFIFRILSAAHYALSNKRAEAAVKTAKRLLCNNTERGDMINTKGVAKALLQYRHMPVLGIWNSPEQMLLGRTLKDTLPTSPQKL